MTFTPIHNTLSYLLYDNTIDCNKWHFNQFLNPDVITFRMIRNYWVVMIRLRYLRTICSLHTTVFELNFVLCWGSESTSKPDVDVYVILYRSKSSNASKPDSRLTRNVSCCIQVCQEFTCFLLVFTCSPWFTCRCVKSCLCLCTMR
jgi:hypothetical protein